MPLSSHNTLSWRFESVFAFCIIAEPGSRPMNIGFRIMKTLREAVSEMERITIQHNTHVVKLITEGLDVCCPCMLRVDVGGHL